MVMNWLALNGFTTWYNLGGRASAWIEPGPPKKIGYYRSPFPGCCRWYLLQTFRISEFSIKKMGLLYLESLLFSLLIFYKVTGGNHDETLKRPHIPGFKWPNATHASRTLSLGSRSCTCHAEVTSTKTTTGSSSWWAETCCSESCPNSRTHIVT